MGQGIQDFYYNAQQRNFARDYQLRVMQFGNSNFDDSDLVFIKTAKLPSRKITVHQVPFQGLQFNLPGNAVYEGSNAWPVTFYATQDFGLRDTLESMSNSIMDIQASGTSGNGGVGNLSLPGSNSVVQLNLVNDQLDVIRTYYLIGVFIVDIGEIDYNLTGTGAPLELKVTLAYQYWTKDLSVLGGSAGGTLGVISNAVNAVSNIANGVSQLSNLL